MDKLLHKIKNLFIKWDQKVTSRFAFVEILLLIFIAIAITSKYSPRIKERHPASPIIYDFVRPEVKPHIPDHLKEYEK